MAFSQSFVKSALKVLLGLVFVVSAVLKLRDMDSFEIYIYSYHFFNLNFSFIVARAAIIVELVLGIGLISQCFPKLMWWGSMAMLGAYTLLLMYAVVMGRTDNCHCFGDYLPFTPLQSLLKNLVLMVLFLLVYKTDGKHFKGQGWALTSLVVVSTLAVFVVSPPDNFSSGYNGVQMLQTDHFETALNEAPLDSLNLKTGCVYCQTAAYKFSLMQQFYGFPSEAVTFVFMGSREGIERFYEQSQSARYRDVLYEDVHGLLTLTNGNFPVIVFMNNGQVVHEYGFRNMKEEEIEVFMTSDS